MESIFNAFNISFWWCDVPFVSFFFCQFSLLLFVTFRFSTICSLVLTFFLDLTTSLISLCCISGPEVFCLSFTRYGMRVFLGWVLGGNLFAQSWI